MSQMIFAAGNNVAKGNRARHENTRRIQEGLRRVRLWRISG